MAEDRHVKDLPITFKAEVEAISPEDYALIQNCKILEGYHSRRLEDLIKAGRIPGGGIIGRGWVSVQAYYNRSKKAYFMRMFTQLDKEDVRKSYEKEIEKLRGVEITQLYPGDWGEFERYGIMRKTPTYLVGVSQKGIELTPLEKQNEITMYIVE